MAKLEAEKWIDERNKLVYGTYTFVEMNFKTVDDNMIFQFKVSFKPTPPSLMQRLGGKSVFERTVEVMESKVKLDPRISCKVDVESFVKFAFKASDKFNFEGLTAAQRQAIKQVLFSTLAEVDAPRSAITSALNNI